MSEQESITKEDFINQMEDFEKNTAREILKIFEDKDYIIPVSVLGLTSIVKALLDNFDTDGKLYEEVLHYLQIDKNDVKELKNND